MTEVIAANCAFFVTFLALDTDKDVFGFAKFLDFHLAKIQPVKLRAQGRNIGGLFELHVNHDAALEIDSEIKAAYGEKEKGQKNHRQRQGKAAIRFPVKSKLVSAGTSLMSRMVLWP